VLDIYTRSYEFARGRGMKTARVAEVELREMQNSESDNDEMNNEELSSDGSAPALLSSSSLTEVSNGLRRRAMSMAESQPSVETVIVKAKRAAQSLWMLLHAQVRLWCSHRR
jgi:hypothetical protein